MNEACGKEKAENETGQEVPWEVEIGQARGRNVEVSGG